MLDICCGDSYILEHISEFIDDYLGVDNNEKYLYTYLIIGFLIFVYKNNINFIEIICSYSNIKNI